MDHLRRVIYALFVRGEFSSQAVLTAEQVYGDIDSK